MLRRTQLGRPATGAGRARGRSAPAIVLAAGLLGAGLATPGHGQAAPADDTRALLAEVRAQWTALAPASRALLLGRRDPRGPSCVETKVRTGTVTRLANPEGGVGTRSVARIWEYRGEVTPKQFVAVCQGPVRTFVAELRETNAPLLDRARAFEATTRRLAERLREATSSPSNPAAPAEAGTGPAWPGVCLTALHRAADQQDLAAARRWADELASAAFALADLHRWVEVLTQNHLTALDFQARCAGLADQDPSAGRPFLKVTSFYPAGRLQNNGLDNYLEVERQAERLFGTPATFTRRDLRGDVVPAGTPEAGGSGAVWMPPDLRYTFAALRETLRRPTRAVLDRAARTPLERSYLANMLWQARIAKYTGALAEVLRRYDRRAGDGGTVGELMDVLFYRGGEPNGGYIRGERYDPRLMRWSSGITGTPTEALQAATDRTRGFFRSWDRYRSLTSLEESLDAGRLDCVTATDMIGALLRNAGCTGVYSVRWTCGTMAHSVAGLDVTADGPPRVAVVDGLAPVGSDLESWPRFFFRSEPWPEGWPHERPPAYAVELYARGLDNYLWCEGYVVRGPHAGTLVRASVPYLRERRQPSVARIFEGPYPPSAPFSAGDSAG